MLTEDAFKLLKKTLPFAFLDNAALKNMTREMLMEFYPKGRTIYRQDGPAAEHLHIIQNGMVKVFVRTNEGEELLADCRTSGDFFGMISFLCGDVSRDTVVAAEDTTCYLVKKETVLGLLKTNAEFSEFCLRSLLTRLCGYDLQGGP